MSRVAGCEYYCLRRSPWIHAAPDRQTAASLGAAAAPATIFDASCFLASFSENSGATAKSAMGQYLRRLICQLQWLCLVTGLTPPRYRKGTEGPLVGRDPFHPGDQYGRSASAKLFDQKLDRRGDIVRQCLVGLGADDHLFIDTDCLRDLRRRKVRAPASGI